jgi:hypothetical protein
MQWLALLILGNQEDSIYLVWGAHESDCGRSFGFVKDDLRTGHFKGILSEVKEIWPKGRWISLGRVFV